MNSLVQEIGLLWNNLSTNKDERKKKIVLLLIISFVICWLLKILIKPKRLAADPNNILKRIGEVNKRKINNEIKIFLWLIFDLKYLKLDKKINIINSGTKILAVLYV